MFSTRSTSRPDWPAGALYQEQRLRLTACPCVISPGDKPYSDCSCPSARGWALLACESAAPLAVDGMAAFG